jgi:hypothetical protein
MNETPKPSRVPKHAAAILLFGVVCATVAIVSLWSSRDLRNDPPAPAPVTAPPPAKPRPTPEEIAAPHLERAYDKSLAAIDPITSNVHMQINQFKRNTRAFADDALGWRSKWNLVQDFVPFSSGDNHEQYIRKLFEEKIFRIDDINRIIGQSIERYLAEVRSIENQMLVELRADVADLPSSSPLAQMDEGQLQRSYADAITAAMAAVGNDLKSRAGNMIVSEITYQVMAHLATRLGISSAILTGGSLGAPYTFGITVVAGLIIDQIVSNIWNWWSDPSGDMARELNLMIDKIDRSVVGSPKNGQGLHGQLRKYAEERAALRKTAVLDVLRGATGVTQ